MGHIEQPTTLGPLTLGEGGGYFLGWERADPLILARARAPLSLTHIRERAILRNFTQTILLFLIILTQFFQEVWGIFMIFAR